MNAQVKKFIEENIDLIEREEFKKLYNNSLQYESGRVGDFTGSLTETLLDAGIDPAKYMYEIPSYYLQGSDIQSYIIPNGITSINNSAFYSCRSLTSVTIPDSVAHIGNFAFWGCSDLIGVMLGNGATSIDMGAFSSCTNLKSITYLGTKAQWAKVNLNIYWKANSHQLKEIKCTDGIINL